MTSDSVGGVHAGAAIHCWPQPREAVAEIARVLEPGGAFCGTTFLTPQLPFADDETQQRVDAAMRELQTAVVGGAGGTGVQAVEQEGPQGFVRRVRVGGFRVRRPRRSSSSSARGSPRPSPRVRHSRIQPVRSTHSETGAR